MSVTTFDHLKPMTEGIVPITIDDRKARLAKARRLMAENDIDAVLIEPGTNLHYFLGLDWGRSERLMAAIIPACGEVAYLCPAFEEARLRELLTLGEDVRVWEEHENPYGLIAGILKDRGASGGRIGLEETVRFFVFDAIRKTAPELDVVSADPVTIPCRAIKSASELALMQRAADITVAAYKACIPLLHEGVSKSEMSAHTRAAHQALGAGGGIGFEFGEGTAYPHGSGRDDGLKEGDVVLMDGGCTIDGYHSDISRTLVFGEPTQRQREIWDLEKRAQAAAFDAAQVGVPFEDVDAAARNVICAAGLGPGYKVPGLPHRTGHGLGLDIHEWYNVVEGNTIPLAPGMCFSNEPMIAVYGEFGVRLEDCVYITEDGPRYFSQPAPSISQSFE